MDHNIMSIEQARAIRSINVRTGRTDISGAKRVDQHSPRPSLDSLSLTELFNIILPRTMADNALENVSEHVLFALWVRLDEEIQQRRQPEFVHMVEEPDDEEEDGEVFAMREGGLL